MGMERRTHVEQEMWGWGVLEGQGEKDRKWRQREIETFKISRVVEKLIKYWNKTKKMTTAL
jgi:hypothetical protein